MAKNLTKTTGEDKRGILPSELTCYLIGDIGKWQCFIAILMSLLKFSVPWVQLGIIFLAYPQEFWCKKPDNVTIPDAIWRNTSQSISGKESCEMNYSNISSTNMSLLVCESFEFDKTIYKSTIISDWSLVCSRAHYVVLSQTCVMFGVLLGNIIFGMISDKHGRKFSLLMCIILQAIAGFASAVTPWFTGFMISRFILALASGGITTVTFVLCLETVGGKWKNIIPILYHIPFGLGNTVLAGIAHILRDWRQIQITLSLISSLYLLFNIFILESPRWLLATGQYEKAINILEKICLYNKRNMNIVRQTVLTCTKYKEKCEKMKIQSILTSKSIRTKSFILWTECFLAGILFFAFVQYVGIVGKNIFLSVALNGISVIPGTMLTLILLKYFDYKKTIIMAQIWTSLCFVLIIAVPNNTFTENWPKIILAILGIVGLSISLPVLSLYLGIIYPTEVRNAGIGIAIMFNRLGSMTSPFIIYLERISPASPYILLCLLTLLQAVLLCFMPETSEKPDKFNKSLENMDDKDTKRESISLMTIRNTNEDLNKFVP